MVGVFFALSLLESNLKAMSKIFLAAQIEIFEVSGKLVDRMNITSNNSEIGLSLGTGIYIMKITNNKGQSTQQKIIIE